MKKVLLALCLGIAAFAFFSPPTVLFLSFVAFAVLATPQTVFALSTDTDGRVHTSLMSVRHLSAKVLFSLMSTFAVLFTIGHVAHRQVDQAKKWLTAMFLAAMRGLANFKLMVSNILKSLATGSSVHQRFAGASPA